MTLQRRTELPRMSAKKLAAFAEAGVRPASTLDKPGEKRKATARPKRYADTGPDAETVEIVLKRDDWKCVSCGDPLYGRRGVEYSIHHRKRRSQGVDNQASNLVSLCGHGTSQCHGATHSEIAQARLVGLLLRSTEDPETVAVEHSQHGLVYLLNDGSVRRAESESAE